MRFAVALLACVVACASTPGSHPRKVSGDRANPYPIAMGTDAAATIRTNAPGAGTWWYRLTVAKRPGTVAVTIHLWARQSSAHAELALVTATGEVSAIGGKLELPATADPPAAYLLRITTARDTRFELTARQSWAAHTPPAPCKRIDDPGCAETSACDLDAPDFTNPACCLARCELAAGKCTAPVTAVGGSVEKIALGKRDHIMVHARGRLVQRDGRAPRVASHVIVTAVGDTEATLRILTPYAVTFGAESWVELDPPEACVDRR
ncbi:MAG: hypothetical protein KIT31_24570 [Deltaproteobacteria bacterium]|nr:hypothetical protein [Deltaproteobacteria bacterium]